MKQIKDRENQSSEEEKDSVPDVSDFEEEDEAASSMDNDDDIFQGQFAIKDASNTGPDECGDRFAALPAKVQKCVDGFERDVLDAIPMGVSELLT